MIVEVFCNECFRKIGEREVKYPNIHSKDYCEKCKVKVDEHKLSTIRP